MKRTATIFILTICLLAIGSWSYAQCSGCGQGHGKTNRASCTGCGKNFVDEDGDGICDNEGSHQGKGNVDHGSQKGNFVDENRDGKCDNMKQTDEKSE